MVKNIWIRAARPRTLIASIAPVILGSALALRMGSFTFSLFFFTLLTGICIQIGTNYANDYFDYKKGGDGPGRIGPIRIMNAGLVTAREMKRAIFFVFALAILFSMPLIAVGGPIIGYLMLLAILCGFSYTAGPYPLAYYGLGDLFVIVFFSIIPTLMTLYLQTKFYLPEALLLGFAAGLFSTAILTVANLRDYPNDCKVNKKTLIVRFGPLFGKYEYALCLLLASLIPIPLYTYFKHDPKILLASLALLPALYATRRVFSATSPSDYLSLLPLTSKIYIAYLITLTLTLVL